MAKVIKDGQKNILDKYLKELEDKRARWIDSVVKRNVPYWKLFLLTKFKNSPIKETLLKLLKVNLEMEVNQLIGNFGYEIVISLNGKVIGRKKYK